MGLLLEILTKHRQLGQTTKLIRNIYIACTLYVQSYTEQWRRGHRCSNFENFPPQLALQARRCTSSQLGDNNCKSGALQ